MNVYQVRFYKLDKGTAEGELPDPVLTLEGPAKSLAEFRRRLDEDGQVGNYFVNTHCYDFYHARSYQDGNMEHEWRNTL